MRLLSLLLFAALLSISSAQSVWFDVGVGYDERTSGSYAARFMLGTRVVYPLDDVTGLYGALAFRRGIVLDAGGWFAFQPNPEDPFGFRSYAGAGLGVSGGDVGAALSLALTYDLSEDVGLGVVYTHRPLILPRLSQAFDVSLTVRFAVD